MIRPRLRHEARGSGPHAAAVPAEEPPATGRTTAPAAGTAAAPADVSAGASPGPPDEPAAPRPRHPYRARAHRHRARAHRHLARSSRHRARTNRHRAARAPLRRTDGGGTPGAGDITGGAPPSPPYRDAGTAFPAGPGRHQLDPHAAPRQRAARRFRTAAKETIHA